LNYADFRVGQLFRAGPYKVEESEIMDFARRWDAQPFHIDPEAAKSTQWQGIIASGWHTCAIAMRLAIEAVLRNSNSSGSPGLEYLSWPHPVRPGDELRLSIEVLELRNSRSNEYGVVRWRWQLETQRGDIVLDTIATSLFGIHSQAQSVVGPS
jgi:acyl dehydratase